jgi:hypothetical protein
MSVILRLAETTEVRRALQSPQYGKFTLRRVRLPEL